MLTSQDTVLKQRPMSEPGIEYVIVIIAVTMAALLVSDPVFPIVVICVALTAAALFNFDFYVRAIIFLLPWYPFLDSKMPVRDISVMSRFVLFAGVWIIQQKRGRNIKGWLLDSKIKKGVLSFAGIATISLLAATLITDIHNIEAYKLLVRLFSNMAVFFAMAAWLDSRERIAAIIKTLLISTIAVALFGYYQAFEDSYTDFYFRLYPLQSDTIDPWRGRITSFLFHFNSLAGYLNLAIPFSIGAITFAKDRWTQYMGLICFATASVALLLTQSRGGLIAYVGILLVSIFYLVRRRVALVGVVAVIALVTGFTVPMLVQYFERLQSIDEATQLSRLALWGSAASMFLAHPVLGVGYGNYRFVSMNYVPEFTGGQLDSHNLYLQLLAETGIIGFLAFFIVVGVFFRIAVKLIKDTDPLYRIVGIGTCGALAATLIHGFVDFLFNVSPQFGALFWVVLALSIAAFQNSQQSAKGVL